MNQAHVFDRPGSPPFGDLIGPGRMRQPVQSCGPTFSDPVGPVAPAEGSGKPLWGRPGGKERATPAFYRHRAQIAGPGTGGTAPDGGGGTGRRALGPGPRGAPARCRPMPQLLRLADARHGCVSNTVA